MTAPRPSTTPLGKTTMNERLPYVWAMPKALGTGMLIHTARPIDSGTRDHILDFTETYESVLSRFREDSPISRMGRASHGGTFTFPSWTKPLFDLVDHLTRMTDGAMDPCVGEDLIRLGYGADMTFTMQPDASGHLGAIHGRPTWRNDVERTGTTLTTTRPVHLDFGACGKGYLVDLLAALLKGDAHATPENLCRHEDGPADDTVRDLVIDAGGDMTIATDSPINVALENPLDTTQAVGIVSASRISLCASAPSRRHWGRMHHLLSALDGRPVTTVAATWVSVDHHTKQPCDQSDMMRRSDLALGPGPDAAMAAAPGTMHTSPSPESLDSEPLDLEPLDSLAAAFPTAVADGLSTSLFVTGDLALGGQTDTRHPHMTYAILYADRHAAVTEGFPGTLFTSSTAGASSTSVDG